MAARLVQQHDLSAAAFDEGAVGAAITISTVSVGAAANSAIMSTDSGSGADVWFSSDTAGTLPLAAKLVYWSDGDSKFKFKVYFGSISAVSGATVYLHVGSKPGGISTDPMGATKFLSAPLIADFADDSGEGNDGTGAGGVAAGGITGPDGVLPATTFDNTDDYVDFGFEIGDLGTTGTMSLWAKVTDFATDQRAFGVFHKTSDKSLLLWMDVDGLGDGWAGYITSTTAAQVVGTNDNNATTSWQHVAMTFSPSEAMKVYVDGALTGTASSAVTAQASAGVTFRAGAISSGTETSEHFLGGLAGINVDSVIRTASEMKADYLLDGPNAATYWTVTDVTRGGTLGRLYPDPRSLRSRRDPRYLRLS